MLASAVLLAPTGVGGVTSVSPQRAHHRRARGALGGAPVLARDVGAAPADGPRLRRAGEPRAGDRDRRRRRRPGAAPAGDRGAWTLLSSPRRSGRRWSATRSEVCTMSARLGTVTAGFDRRIGESVSAAVCRHHRRRLGGLGKASLIAESGGWAGGRAAAARRQSARGADRRRDGAAGAWSRRSRGARSHVHVAGWYLTPEFVLTARRPAGDRARPAGRDRRAGPRRACCCGRARRCRCSARPRRDGARRARRAARGTRDPLRARRARAAAALPPREDRDRRRRGRVRRRHRPDGPGRRPPRLAAAPARAAAIGWHDVAAAAARARWSPTWPRTSRCAGAR